MNMTPTLLFALLAVLFAVLLWQLRNLWLWNAGRGLADAPRLQQPAVKPPPKRVESPQAGDPTRLSVKSTRKRGLSSIHASLDGRSAAEDLINSGLYNEVEGKLAQAFELYADGAISLERYEVIVRNEEKAVRRKRSELTARESAGGTSSASLNDLRQDVESAEIAVQWCLDWAADRRIVAPLAGPDAGEA